MAAVDNSCRPALKVTPAADEIAVAKGRSGMSGEWWNIVAGLGLTSNSQALQVSARCVDPLQLSNPELPRA
jgi:hypothetical protein